MSTIAAVFKSEIARVARKELRAELDALRKTNAHYRSELAALKRRLHTVESQLRRLGKVTAKVVQAGDSADENNADGAGIRFSAKGFATLRKRLGLSAAQMGKLLGASQLSVYKWESGKAHPRAGSLQAIAQVRSIGKKEAARRLEQMA